ncbi:MAG: ABC transporter permease [Defluviitaleaceae bacterium]|nr:ABC transporter permease [Defluviitaleaceae bacterium]
MINFLLRKMWKNKWLLLCLLAGNILLIGITSSTPMYSNATITRMAHQAMRLRQVNDGIYPAFSQLSLHFSNAAAGYEAQVYRFTTDTVFPEVMAQIGIPAQTIKAYSLANWQTYPAGRRINLLGVQGMEENITITHGRMPSENPVIQGQTEIIEIIAMSAAMLQQDLLLDELIRIENVYDQEAGKPYLLAQVVGIFEIHEHGSPFWAVTSPDFTRDVLIHQNLVPNRFIENYAFDYRLTVSWHSVHDYMQMTGGSIRNYMNAIAAINERFAASQQWNFHQNFYDLLQDHVERAAEFNIALIILQVPIYFLLAFYIYVVSRKILQLEQNDISVLKSRGASRLQIFGIYVGQGLFVGLIALPLGLALGVGICHILGASSGFLELMGRSNIVVEISPQVLVFGGAASLFSFFAMVLPVIRFSKLGIVEFKRGKDGKLKKALWQRYFLDIACLGFSVYGIWNFNNQQEMLGNIPRDFIDPTLFLSSTLFMVGLGLFCLRVFPYIVKLVFFIGRRFMPVSLYTALVRVARSSGEEQFIMIFLVFTMAIGIFSAQTARTINLNAEHETRYLGGTDFTFRELWPNNRHQFAFGFAGELIFNEPSLTRFDDFEEIEVITRVKTEEVSGRRTGPGRGEMPTSNITLMAIETQSFGYAAWFRDDFLPIHINYYLNVLSQVPNGILVSESFRDRGFVVGNTIILEHQWRIWEASLPPDQNPRIIHSETPPMVIIGFLERFPTFEPFTQTTLADDNTIIQDNHLVVGNLGFFHHQWGVWPYDVWLRTNTETNQFFHDFMQENGLRPVTQEAMRNAHLRGLRHPYVAINDVSNAVVQTRLDPLIQGTNGVLTVNFIATLLICFSGFLIYWLLSIRERVLQFGIFRAMGMRMKSIIAMLIHEQILITLTALIIGAVVGELTARLYVPLIQLAYSNQVIPMIVVMETRDYTTLYTVMATMVVICVAILISFISRIRIDQALKLGED